MRISNNSKMISSPQGVDIDSLERSLSSPIERKSKGRMVMSKLIFASVISEIQQSDVFMTVKARICEAPQANLNGARVTEAFIDEIVSNETRYVGLPLYADKKALIGGNYTRLGHLYDTKTGEFHSTQIGSFYKFEKQVNGENCYLVGYARIPKRNKKLSKAISELFADGALKFSFELSVGEYTELDDDTILIDASENNYLEGTAIVTYPACEDAVALELVAQQADETRKGESEMAEVEIKAEVVETEAVQPEMAEEEEKVEEVSEDEETAACKKKEKAEDETAAVYVTENHVEVHESNAYDTETGKSVSQRVVVETMSTDEVEGTLVETVDGVHVAETELAEGDGDPQNEDPQNEDPQVEDPQNENSKDGDPVDPESEEADPIPEETDQDSYDPRKKKTAEQLISELAETIEGLKAEIAELKEKKSVTAEFNPFMENINAQGKYSLLEKESPKQKYSLLD